MMQYSATYEIALHLGIIFFAAKVFGILARRLGIPQVVGEILAGLLIGPSFLGIVSMTEPLTFMSEIGVILLMFSAGLGTNMKDLKQTGPVACLIATAGVLVPLVLGTLIYMIFYGFAPFGSLGFYKAVFIGVILTATSVSITVKALSELGHLKTKMGVTIVSAAIIDDVLGIIVLTIVLGMSGGSGGGASALWVIVKSLLFFVMAGGAGWLLFKIFDKLDQKYQHTQRIPILGLAMCMFFSYAAEKFFGVAEITGAFVAGLVLCNLKDAPYIERKMDINSYMFFGPIFFAGIGLKTDLHQVSSVIIAFSVAMVAVALLSKILGCGLMAKLTGYSNADSLKIGVGMMNRGEVALIVSQKGLNSGLLEPTFFTPVILLIIVSSILTPILLKKLYQHDEKRQTNQKEVA